MSPIEFSLQVILVSTSGVLSPGPLFFINILYGSKYGFFIGLKIASGHAIVEFPLIIAPHMDSIHFLICCTYQM